MTQSVAVKDYSLSKLSKLVQLSDWQTLKHLFPGSHVAIKSEVKTGGIDNMYQGSIPFSVSVV